MPNSSLKIFYCLMVLSCAANIASAQKNINRDSLLRLLPSSKNDSNKAKQLHLLAIAYQMSNQDSSDYYLQQEKELSEKIGFTRGVYGYYEQRVVLLFTKGDYNAAITAGAQALRMARQLKDSALVATCLVNMGIAYSYLGDYNGQLSRLLQAKNILEQIKDSSKLSPIYHNLANSYAFVYQYQKSLDYALLSIKLCEQYGKKNAYLNRVYSSAAQAWQVLRKYDSALVYFKIAINKSQQINDQYAIAAIYSYMAELYGLMNDFKSMLDVSNKSLGMAQTLQSRELEAKALNTMALAEMYNGENAKAKNYVQQAMAIATKDSILLETSAGYTALSYIAATEKDFSTSFSAKSKADSIQRVVLNNEVVKTSSDLEKKYETEQKEAQIKQLKSDAEVQQLSLRQKNLLNIILIASATALLIIVALTFRFYRQRQKLQQQRITELETEKQLAATEAVLKGEELERTRMAKDLHDGLGGMLSGIKYSLNTMKGNLIMTPENAQAFERSIDMLDSSIQEMRRVAHNMMPQALVNFGLDAALQDFCNDINQSGALQINYQSIGLENAEVNQTTSIAIYRIVQELINNTMKHAAAKTAIVQVTDTNGQMSITVEDDGKGFDINAIKQQKGLGWRSIQNRIELLKGTLDIHSTPEKGTSVLIEFNT